VMPFGSNIDVARCGWDAHMMSNSRLRDCGIQNAAARAMPACARFYWGFGGATLVALIKFYVCD
ncbi:MAG: hypothetical protein K2N70_02285, partial [Helicobacter sp.]|nr:hypothetical protein [Helicobacter sp.]